jgi:N-formylmaleamate deformylase
VAATFRYGAQVRANGIRQHYLRFGGTGTPLVVIPGIVSPAATWAFVGERLGARHDTYVLDVRGRGLSASGSDLDYGLDTHARDVAEFACTLGFARYDVLGHSMGGRIAARLAHRHPTSIGRVVLADPPVSGPGRRPYVKPLPFYLEAIAQAVAGTLDVEASRAAYPRWNEQQIRLRAEWLHTCNPDAVVASHRSFHDDDIHRDLAAIAGPTLLLAAGEGGVITDDDLAEIAALNPAIARERLAGAGHMLPFDDLEGFLAIVERFLQSG